MSIIFDIAIAFILLASIYTGYKKGIIDVGFRLVAIILSLLVSLVLCSPITYFIVNNTEIDEQIEQVIIKNGILNTEKSKVQNGRIDEYVQNYAKDAVKDAQNAVVEATAKPIAINVIKIGVTMVLFLITRIILVILKMFTNILTKIPILKQCNELAGLAYGILRGLVIIYGILAILYFIITISGVTDINKAIGDSYITKIFFDYNPILGFVKGN